MIRAFTAYESQKSSISKYYNIYIWAEVESNELHLLALL